MSIVDEAPVPYHITWVTHNSRVSERMIKYRVKRGEPLLLSAEQEVEITQSISRTVMNKKLVVLAYNICRDHVHLILECDCSRRDHLVGCLKGEATARYKCAHKIGETFHLWGQKYNWWAIASPQQLTNTIEYIRYNRRHHNLTPNYGLRPIVEAMLSGTRGGNG
jgi:REP element-mobilizing transposase RayT